MSASTPSSRLVAKLDLAAPVVRAASERIWCSPRVRDLYPVYLVTMHGIVRSAAPLLRAARAQARRLAPADAVAAALVPYLARHAPEEEGHDEWLLEDLEALGWDRTDALRRIPSARVASFAGAQYYWLRHCHPVALLGHMAFVEGNPPSPGFADRLRRLTGYPADAFRALRRHERLDIRHRKELYEAIDSLPLGQYHETIMGLSALHTASTAVDIFGEILAAAPAPVPEPVP